MQAKRLALPLPCFFKRYPSIHLSALSPLKPRPPSEGFPVVYLFSSGRSCVCCPPLLSSKHPPGNASISLGRAILLYPHPSFATEKKQLDLYWAVLYIVYANDIHIQLKQTCQFFPTRQTHTSTDECGKVCTLTGFEPHPNSVTPRSPPTLIQQPQVSPEVPGEHE